MSPFWQATISTLAGVVVGFLLVVVREWWRERPRLTVKIVGGRCAYASRAMQFIGSISPSGPQFGDSVWVQADPSAPKVTLVLQLDLLWVNTSHIDNAVHGVRLVIHRKAPLVVNCPAMQPAEGGGTEPFSGVSVPANSFTQVRLRFEFPKETFGQFPEWTFDEKTHYTLEATPIRGREKHLRVEPMAHVVLGLKDGASIGI
jgi:hypothetical protein